MQNQWQLFPVLFLAIHCLNQSHANDIPLANVVPKSVSEISPEDKLLRLAKEYFKAEKQDILPGEEKLLRAVATGKSADFLQGQQEVVDPQIAAHWKEDRIIRGDRLAWLCADAAASALVTSRDISISGARIDGEVDLERAKVTLPLNTWKCIFTGIIRSDNCRIRSLFLKHTYITSFEGNGLIVEEDLAMADGFTSEGEVSLIGAKIGGQLNFIGAQFIGSKGIAIDAESSRIDGSVELGDHFKAQGEVNLLRSKIGGSLECDGGEFINCGKLALNADAAKIDGRVLLGGNFTAQGQVNLVRATIGGNLICMGGHFINNAGTALEANSARIDGHVFLTKEFEAHGAVDFATATIQGNLECEGGHFFDGLSADASTIRGHVHLISGFEASGRVGFAYADIGRSIQLSEIRSREKASLDLRYAKANTLYNDKPSWPTQDHLLLDGFTYDNINDKALDHRNILIEWLRLQSRRRFFAQPYEQWALAFRHMGREEEAKKVMIAKNERLGQSIPLRINRIGDLIWYRLLGPIIGYGYRPWNAFWISVVVIYIGWLLFWIGYRAGLVTPVDDREAEDATVCKRLELYPRFSAFVYSLETFVPLLKLWVSQYWIPNANRGRKMAGLRELMLTMAVQLLIRERWKRHWLGKIKAAFEIGPTTSGAWLRSYLWCHIIAGWVFTTLWVAGLTGLIKT